MFVKIQSYIYLIFLPLIAGCLLLAKPAIRLIYQRGAFDGESVRLTQSVFMIYAAGMFTAAFRDLFQNFFFALKNNFANLLLGCAALLFNTGLDLLLIRRFGHNGLVLATISSTTLCAGYIFMFFKSFDFRGGGRERLRRLPVSARRERGTRFYKRSEECFL